MIKPLGDNLLVKVIVAETTTASGIYIPDAADKERTQTGTVLAVGPGKLLDNGTYAKMEVSPHDKVMFPKGCGTEVTVDNEKVFVLPYSKLLGVFC